MKDERIVMAAAVAAAIDWWMYSSELRRRECSDWTLPMYGQRSAFSSKPNLQRHSTSVRFSPAQRHCTVCLPESV